MGTQLAWGILGTGRIAKTFAQGLAGATSGRLVAVGSRKRESAEAFGAAFDVPHRHATYEALLADPDVQAVYISLPHPLHAQWTIRAADAGKHILCEKPLGVNHAEAMAMVEAAIRNRVFLMEAFMYRCRPLTARLVELIRQRAIGEVQLIQAAFSFHTEAPPEHRLMNHALAGGGILDVGCYTVSMACLIAGAAAGKSSAEPNQVHGLGRIGPTRIDEYASALLGFPGGIIAQLTCGVKLEEDSRLRIFGSEGTITVPVPYFSRHDGGPATITVKRHERGDEQVITIPDETSLFRLEADTAAACIASGKVQADSPAMTWDDSLVNMGVLDRWRQGVGLVYDLELPENNRLPLNGLPLTVRQPTAMRYGKILGVEKPVSRLIMGVDNQWTMPHAAVMFDDFFERGGTCFDTAHVYKPFREKFLGQWVRSRGLRDRVVVIVKGAHTPFCNPTDLTRQLNESLANLQFDYADLYLMHRDNLDIPVGAFIDCLNEHLRAGRIHAFGVSNWTLKRVEEANAYAQAKGLVGFSAVSNNLSLARMINPVWGGAISSSDAESRAWFAKAQLPLLSWSSQARGFFTDRSRPDLTQDGELVHGWYSEDNFRRKQRVVELAAKRGVQPINVALAYVLCQPFPTYALIGPRRLAETRSSWAALDLALTPDEVRWLNLEA
jgi:predicted dehydrogenase/aryl-alcohol dehydrogenase-like predicted oxidoreductase